MFDYFENKDFMAIIDPLGAVGSTEGSTEQTEEKKDEE